MFRIQFTSLTPSSVEVYVKSQTGQVVYYQKNMTSSGINTWQVQKQSNWSPGMYFVEIVNQGQGEILRKRILVQ
jgi:hypothetical protein